MRILLIEDDSSLCNVVAKHLSHLGYLVDICLDGEEGLMLAKESIYDLIILDRMLPSLDGLTITRSLRSEHITTPIIMVTALNRIGDRVEGLDTGADDYLVKPFDMQELSARIRALSRRPVALNVQSSTELGNTQLDLTTMSLSTPYGQCTLSKKEGLLFETFFKQPAHTFARSYLILRTWGPESEIEDGNLDNYIHFLRRRLKTIKSNLSLKTVRGIGYMLEVCDA